MKTIFNRQHELFSKKENARKEGETRIYNLIIIDESGSMGGIENQTLSGANEVIGTIKRTQQENPDDNQMVCVVTFDSGSSRPDVRAIVDCEMAENVKDLTRDQYNPRGCTPLYDAIGVSVTNLQKHVKEGDHVLVTIITDGYENSSHRFTSSMVASLIKELSEKGWTFTFIGANQDSVLSARELNIQSAMDFEASYYGAKIMWDRMDSSYNEFYKRVRYNKKNGVKEDLSSDFFASDQSMLRVTPENITELKDNEVFVFGSNIYGMHNGGAAKLAKERFGAVFGQARGLQGQSYAIPTTEQPLKKIAEDVYDFILFADQHPELTFYVTRIGCGHAGYTPDQIAPMFARAYNLPNVYLPAEFWKILTYKY